MNPTINANAAVESIISHVFSISATHFYKVLRLFSTASFIVLDVNSEIAAGTQTFLKTI